MNTVITETYTAPEWNTNEILRYAQCKDASVPELLEDCISEAENVLSYKICHVETDITVCGNSIDCNCFKFCSSDLAKNLKDCEKVIVFAATVGIGIDRLISKYSRLSPAKALIFQAIGAERIESLCDVFCSDLKKKGYLTVPRFSPGYGDLPLDIQKNIFAVLDCPRKIGLTLNSSLLMSPSKSVTAFIGVKKCK